MADTKNRIEERLQELGIDRAEAIVRFHRLTTQGASEPRTLSQSELLFLACDRFCNGQPAPSGMMLPVCIRGYHLAHFARVLESTTDRLLGIAGEPTIDLATHDVLVRGAEERARMCLDAKDRTEARVQELESEVAAAESAYQGCSEARDAIRAELTATQDELRVCKSVRDAAERRVTMLEGELTAAKESVKDIHGVTLSDRIVALRTRNVDLSAESSRLKSELAALRGEGRKRPEVAGLGKLTHVQNARLVDLAHEWRMAIFDGAGSERSEAWADIVAYVSELMDSAVSSVRAELEETRAELDRVNADIHARADDISGIRTDLVDRLRAELTTLRARVVPPLTEEQREELAKVAYRIVYTEESWARGLHQTHEATRERVYRVVDTLALRIARVGVTYVESLLAPDDGVRVELGAYTLGQFGHWTQDGRSLLHKGDHDRLVTAALSAKPGDTFEFDLVARKVGG